MAAFTGLGGRRIPAVWVGGSIDWNWNSHQATLLNLGRHFAVDQDQWSALCSRIDELVSHQSPLFAINLTPSVEREAQRIAEPFLNITDFGKLFLAKS